MNFWPEEDKHILTRSFLQGVMGQFANHLINHAQILYNRVSAYRNRLTYLNRKSKIETLTIDNCDRLQTALSIT